ncbi:MAG: dTDP-4-dehydrorhamnose reductase [Gammaproteobacteria bacterium]|nr:dTDP-4-dehydrorhamnose reductase [Gammaproteobacteria bacterium]
MMKVLLAGAGGQLGWELQQCPPDNVELVACTSADLDIRDEAAVLALAAELSPQLIINAAAYTAVDKAESEPERAFAVNADGAAHLALAARQVGARMIQLSTDYVFDGSHSSPYSSSEKCSPLGVYGTSKYQGEQRVRAILPRQSVILRTAWVYSTHGNNFVKSMLRLMAQRDELGVVADQLGSPTSARTLAQAVWGFTAQPQLQGLFHWTDAGVASWYDFAVAIMEEALVLGLLPAPVVVKPIRTCDYPTAARRPAYSVLEKSTTWEQLAVPPLHWRVALREMLAALPRG